MLKNGSLNPVLVCPGQMQLTRMVGASSAASGREFLPAVRLDVAERDGRALGGEHADRRGADPGRPAQEHHSLALHRRSHSHRSGPVAVYARSHTVGVTFTAWDEGIDLREPLS